MSDYFEIDFLNVESKKSGDAIALRYSIDGETSIHVVDGGFQATGEKLVAHLNKYYESPALIDHVVATHNDGDHAGGLRTVLDEIPVGTLWILRPWEYADELIDRFSRFTSVENLRRRLRDIYPNLVALEELALEKSIPMLEPFQGAEIGAFTVASPTKDHWLDMIVSSEKTPEVANDDETAKSASALGALAAKAVTFIRALWGEEVFSSEETSAENEMSVVQYAVLCDQKILLSGDAGRRSLEAAADFVTGSGIGSLPGIDRIQVPHHGSRRNVSSEILDRWLGEKVAQDGEAQSTAIISCSEEDKDHPKRAVVRAFMHRGATVLTTAKATLRTSQNAPDRPGWSAATPLTYPEDQEE